MTIDQFNFAGKKAFVRVDFNVPLDELDEMTTLVREVMESVYPDLRVPLEVSIGHGANWLEAH